VLPPRRWRVVAALCATSVSRAGRDKQVILLPPRRWCIRAALVQPRMPAHAGSLSVQAGRETESNSEESVNLLTLTVI